MTADVLIVRVGGKQRQSLPVARWQQHIFSQHALVYRGSSRNAESEEHSSAARWSASLKNQMMLASSRKHKMVALAVSSYTELLH